MLSNQSLEYLGQNVRLYCSATLVGLNPKLIKRWVAGLYLKIID